MKTYNVSRNISQRLGKSVSALTGVGGGVITLPELDPGESFVVDDNNENAYAVNDNNLNEFAVEEV